MTYPIHRRRFALSAIAMLALACGAHAETYRCKEGGKVVFSDRICGTNAEAINVKPASGDAPAAGARYARQSADTRQGANLHREPAVRVKVAKSAGHVQGTAAPAAPPDR
jgi:hypothetical protein